MLLLAQLDDVRVVRAEGAPAEPSNLLSRVSAGVVVDALSNSRPLDQVCAWSFASAVMTSPRVWADYMTVGHARTFTVLLNKTKRDDLVVGDAVVVEGDDVHGCPAKVTAVQGRHVTVTLDPDLACDLNFEDDDGLALARVPASGAPHVGEVLTAGGTSSWTWAEVVSVEDGWIRLRAVGIPSGTA